MKGHRALGIALLVLAALLFVILITGCANEPLLTSIERVEIPKPVFIRCLKSADIPEVPDLPPPEGRGQKQWENWAAAVILLFDQYTARSDAMLRDCAG